MGSDWSCTYAAKSSTATGSITWFHSMSLLRSISPLSW